MVSNRPACFFTASHDLQILSGVKFKGVISPGDDTYYALFRGFGTPQYMV
jgi:hypothetical protein